MGFSQENPGKMKKSILLLPALFLFILVPYPARADVSVSLRLDREKATVADFINLVVRVSGTRDGESRPVLNGVENFDVTLQGTSSRIEVINGKITSGIDFNFFIHPEKTGTFEIGPAEVTINGKTFKSNTATLTIIERPRSSGADRGSIFLTAGLSSNEVFAEEQTIYTLKLYRRVRVSDISLDLPEMPNLTLKQLGKPAEYQSVYNGQTYQVLEVNYALIPLKEGVYWISSSKMDMTVFQSGRRSPRSMFDDSFFSFSSGRPMTLAGDSLQLNVLPLPDEGRPEKFSGLVGSFRINSKLEPRTIKAGESATLTVSLSGRGNINRMPDLNAPEIDNTKVYADEPVLTVGQDTKGLAGSKTMKWALVPEKEGRYEIPCRSVSFFNTKTRKYRTIKTTPLSLSVLPGKKEQVQVLAGPATGQKLEGPAQKAVKELGHDILPVHSSVKDLWAGPNARVGAWVLWSVFLMPPLIYILMVLGLKAGKRSDGSVAASKARKAAKRFSKQCSRPGLGSGDLTLFTRDYLNDRFGLSLGSLTPDEAADILKSRGVSPDTSGKLRAMLQKLEDAVYTGKGQETCAIGQDISRLVTQIEKEIR